MKKWLTGGTLQGVMGQVVGCGVELPGELPGAAKPDIDKERP
jgi:hypothetical protein